MSHELLELIANIRTSMTGVNQRALVVLAGDHGWSLGIVEAIRALYTDTRAICISDAVSGAHAPATNLVNKLVGQEFDLAIYDAWSGFDPNMLGGLIGTLCGGGLFILCTPTLEQWPDYDDPVRKRILSYPGVATGQSQYLLRFIRMLYQDDTVYVVNQDAPLPVFNPVPCPMAAKDRGQRQEQQNAVAAVLHLCTGHTHRPLVILADRGRGKSSALGMACAELMQQGKEIILCATRKQAAAIVYKHIDLEFDENEFAKEDRERLMAHLRFIPPDALAYEEHHADLLVIDEAATIGISLLNRILQRYPRIVFASTVNGYEGTGRGLELKFFPHLDRQTPDWKLLQLQDPVRWAKDDPLETFMNRALLLKHKLPEMLQAEYFAPDKLVMQTATIQDLRDNEEQLQQIYGLLVISHYRTAPLDLRIILDNPAVRIHYAHVNGQIVATAMTIQEGGIRDESLNAQIASGNRRVHGHLLPQALTYYSGIAESMTLSCLRVIRIAVYPPLQRRGIGSRLLEYIEDWTAGSCDYTGASFALDEAAFPIWRKAGYSVVRVGYSTGSSSGQHAVFMVKGKTVHGNVYAQLWKKYHDRNFTEAIPALFHNIRPEMLSMLLAETRPESDPGLSDLDRKSLEDFLYRHKDIDFVFTAIRRLVHAASRNGQLQGLENRARELLLLRFVEMKDWKSIQRITGITGKKMIIDGIREAVRVLFGQSD